MLRRTIVQTIVVAAAYLLTGVVGLALAHEHQAVTLVWPPTGIAIAALYLGGLRLWPGVLVGAVGAAIYGGCGFWLALAVGAGNTLEALVAFAILRAPSRFDPRFWRRRDLVWFTLGGVILAPLTSAAVGTTSLCLFGAADWADHAKMMRDWWLGDAAGALIVAPFILTWARARHATPWSRPRALEAVAVLCAAIVTSMLVWTPGIAPSDTFHPMAFLPFPALIWAAGRFGAVGASTATLSIAIVAVHGTANSVGPFTSGTLGANLALLWTFVGVSALTALGAAVLSERDRTVQALGTLRRRLETAQQVGNVGSFEYDLGADRLWWSGGLDLIVGRSAQQEPPTLAGWLARVHPDDRERVGAEVERALLGSGPSRASYRIVTDDGETRHVEGHMRVELAEDGSAARVVGTIQDVTERRRVEHGSLLLQRAIDCAPEAMLTLDREGNIVSSNATAAARLGYEEGTLLGRHASAIDPGFDTYNTPETWERLVETGRLVVESEHLTRDGVSIPVEVSIGYFQAGGVPYVSAFARDITERRENAEAAERMVAQMQHAQKLESLGVLAGGIAHDFNNLLVGILGNAELAMDQVPQGEPLWNKLESISRAGRRAAELCREMLAYAGKSHARVEPTDLSKLVEDMVGLLRASVTAAVQIRCDLAPLPLPIEADRAQLRQVVMNLVTNASDAAAQSGGSVRVRTGTVDCTPETLQSNWLDDALPSGTYAFVEVADDGPGMDADTLQRIFEPFFTTKAQGRGLGLSATLGIIRSHRGAVQVESQPGEGTTMRALLPLSPGAEVDDEPTFERVQRQGSTARILVVDDEAIARDVARDALQPAGFEVSAVGTGQEALDLLDQGTPTFDLVLLDLTMPGLSGHETFRRIRSRGLQIPVILSSGFLAREPSDDVPSGYASFLDKPYRPSALVAAVRSALAKPPA
ncbi:MAG: MASE1 domain-containing protein [Myxococcota bacterium]